MAKASRRAALYVRVSTDQQSVDNQVRELRQIAERRGWTVIHVYSDAGISGAKGRDKRPGLDAMLKDASRRKFDVVMAWAIDRLGRSLVDLLGTIQHLEATGVDLYLDQQNLDTTTPMGKLLFQVTGAFAEFERAMIRQRVKAGLRHHQGQDRPGRQVRDQGGQDPQAAGPAWGGASEAGGGAGQAGRGSRHREGCEANRSRNRHSAQAQAGDGCPQRPMTGRSGADVRARLF